MGIYRVVLRKFSNIGIKYLKGYVSPLKEAIIKSNLNIIFELYVGKMLLISFFGLLVVFAVTSFYITFIGFPLVFGIISGLILGITMFFILLTVYHSYPYHLLTSKKSKIDENMPFAINHMAAIAASGVPPFIIFKIIATVPEYSEIKNEAEAIERNIEVFGMDIISAVKNVAERTPSPAFKQFLSGIIASIETGGDLKKYLENSARDAMFEYRLKREKYLQTLSTYADFYTAVLIAAPLFFISILSVMALIGGQIFGLSIPMAMTLGTYLLIPLLNIAFIAFVHYTQPSL